MSGRTPSPGGPSEALRNWWEGLRGREAPGPPLLGEQLRLLEERARIASQGTETQYWIQAGLLCVGAGEPARAVDYYTRALDVYLNDGRWNAALALCRKVEEFSPETVRIRCTHAWLSLGKSPIPEVKELIWSYTRASWRQGQEELAAPHLRWMEGATAEPEVREVLGLALLELGDEEGGDRVLERLLRERAGAVPPRRCTQEDWIEAMVRAALLSPREVRGEGVRMR